MKRCIALFLAVTLLLSALSGCGTVETQEGLGNGWKPERSMELQFATQFSVDYYQDGYKLISLADGTIFLLIPSCALSAHIQRHTSRSSRRTTKPAGR